MTSSIATLLIRNLHGVFEESDPQRRRGTIEEIFTEDARFYEPNGVRQGWDEIDQIAGTIRATHPDFRYTLLQEPEELHGTAGRIQWVSGLPGQNPAYAGSDFIVAGDDGIAELYVFFDEVAA